MFRPLLVSGNNVLVNGKILSMLNSEYQISVEDKQPLGFVLEGNNQR